jgi:metal-responsive CopG/Arc/MetJ family transcriptional regulator
MKKRKHHRKFGAVKTVCGSTIVCTNVSKDLAADIDALSDAEGISRSDLIRSAIVREVAFRSYIKERDISSSEIGGGFKYGANAEDKQSAKQYAEHIAIAYKAFNAALALK